MRKLIMKLLGLNDFVSAVDFSIDLLRKENEALQKQVKDLTDEVQAFEERIEEIQTADFDPDDYVREDDINDRIESYCNDNDIVSSSWVDDELESRVSEKVEEAIDDLDISDKVEEAVKEMDKASFGDTEELTDIVRKVIKSVKFKVE